MKLIDRLRDIRKQGAIIDHAIQIDHATQKAVLDYLDVISSPDLPVIEIGNVADYLAADLRHLGRAEVLSCAVPPFSRCWMECHATVGSLTFLKDMGGLIETVDLRSCSSIEKVQFFQSIAQKPCRVEEFDEQRLSALAWIVTGRFCFGLGTAVVLLDKNGVPLTEAHAKLAINKLTMTAFDLKQLHDAAGSVGISDQMALDVPVWLAMRVCCLAASFMSCKNVQLVENQPPRYERRQREREKKPPLTKFYTLEIEPMKKILRTEGKNEEVGLKKALHICRGNFAYYTPDNPLFGKLTGRFWRPAHVRGSKEAGEIKKDYRVLSPKEKTEK